jgi:hypothetical protein
MDLLEKTQSQKHLWKTISICREIIHHITHENHNLIQNFFDLSVHTNIVVNKIFNIIDSDEIDTDLPYHQSIHILKKCSEKLSKLPIYQHINHNK